MNAPPAPRFLEQVRDRLRYKRLSLRTEEAYLGWTRRFILFHGKRHLAGLGEREVVAFLRDLALRHRMAASTHDQVLNPPGAARLVTRLEDVSWLAAALLYGAGLRLMERLHPSPAGCDIGATATHGSFAAAVTIHSRDDDNAPPARS